MQDVISSNSKQASYLRDPDVQLMLRTQEGDEQAFALLVENYQDRLISIFTHVFHSQDQAEDLAQDVFMRIYRARMGYKPTAKFSTWLFRIANNLASNSQRNKGRKREVAFKGGVTESGSMGVRPEEHIVADKSAFLPTRQLDQHEMKDLVQDAIASLNENQRIAVLLHKFEGMSYADIGETMELSISAVKSLLSRARENLRMKLEKHVQHT